MTKRRVVCIVGPTACGKTELSVLLAERIDAEIVSADSVQVYIGMDIGSAKPTQVERRGIAHHMLDCVPVDTPAFSVSQYTKMACAAIDDILSRGKTPLVVGGSGLYINALTFPLGFAIPRDEGTRDRLSRAYNASPQEAFAHLRAIDPVTATRLHPNDKKRIVRALEVYECTGKPLSAFGGDFLNEQGREAPCLPYMIGLDMARDALYARIDQRVDAMMETGLIQEARALYDAGYARTLPAMQSIGYKQLFSYFDGVCMLPDAVEQIKRDTRRFAKRQFTWFRRDKRIVWHDVTRFSYDRDALLASLSNACQEWMKGTDRA